MTVCTCPTQRRTAIKRHHGRLRKGLEKKGKALYLVPSSALISYCLNMGAHIFTYTGPPLCSLAVKERIVEGQEGKGTLGRGSHMGKGLQARDGEVKWGFRKIRPHVEHGLG